jgi:hypothetical protein
MLVLPYKNRTRRRMVKWKYIPLKNWTILL